MRLKKEPGAMATIVCALALSFSAWSTEAATIKECAVTCTVTASEALNAEKNGGLMVKGDSTNGSIVVNLPATRRSLGAKVWTVKWDSSVNTVTVDPAGSETVSGSSTVVLASQYEMTSIVAIPNVWVNPQTCGSFTSTGAATFGGGFGSTGTSISATGVIQTDGAITSALGITGTMFTSTPQTLTVADNGGGTAATATLTPTSSVVLVVCSDADGCTITMGEGSAVSGQRVTIINTSANAATFADTSGVSETAGAFVAGQYDVLNLVYVPTTWVETSRSNN